MTPDISGNIDQQPTPTVHSHISLSHCVITRTVDAPALFLRPSMLTGWTKAGGAVAPAIRWPRCVCDVAECKPKAEAVAHKTRTRVVFMVRSFVRSFVDAMQSIRIRSISQIGVVVPLWREVISRWRAQRYHFD